LPRTKADWREEYKRGVFVDCPFDAAYRAMFNAIVFTVFFCGMTPRSALEIDDANKSRIDKIVALISDCRLGIHDISRGELNEHGLPRFNMPLELGLFMGAQRFSGPARRQKESLVLDEKPFGFYNFISDIAGHDVTPHGGPPPEG
jgi:hypothetical protein